MFCKTDPLPLDCEDMKRAYFDHASATPVDPRVVKVMEPYLTLYYGNPSAIHQEGVFARRALEEARKKIAGLLGGEPDELIFTGSATESANLAIVGVVRAWQVAHPGARAHIILSAIEHDAVREPVALLEKEGVRVTRLSVDGEGIANLTTLYDAICMETVLVSVMYANNEVGTIQPIRDIAKIIRKWKKEHRGVVRTEKPKADDRLPLFHTDACQAANYCDLRVKSLGVDLMTLSAAKIYGPKGVGLLYGAREVPLLPLTRGGGQERGLRAGTENVSGIIGFEEALTIAQETAVKESERLVALRDALFAQLSLLPGIIINGSRSERLPNNVHFSLPGVDHEFLALALDARGFAVATKSACNEFDAEISHVLVAMREGDGNAGPESGIRLSLGRSTTREGVDAFIVALQDILETMIVSV